MDNDKIEKKESKVAKQNDTKKKKSSVANDGAKQRKVAVTPKKTETKENTKEVVKNIATETKSESATIEDVDLLASKNVSQETTKVQEVRQKKNFKYTSLAIIVLLVACVSLFTGALITYYALDDDKSDSDFSQTTSDANIDKFIKIYNEILGKHYLDLDKNKLIEGAINGMLDMTGDPHSAYWDSDEADSFNEVMNGTYYGIGSEIISDIDGKVYFYNVFDDSPVARAGIQSGDIIKAVDGVSVEGKSTTEISAMIKHDGTTEKTVAITYERAEEEYTVSLTTELINIPSVYHKIFEQNGKTIGYIQITVFAANTSMQYLEALNDLTRENVEGLIIDVRDNSGGYLSTVDTILDNSLPSGSIKYQMKTKTEIKKEYVSAGRNIEIPIVVLQNTGSASGSEMLAIAYKDVYNATIIGNASYGKNTVQGVENLSDGSMLKYTIKEWLSPNGTSIGGVGIEPTIKVDLDTKYYESGLEADDNQLQTALEHLTK